MLHLAATPVLLLLLLAPPRQARDNGFALANLKAHILAAARDEDCKQVQLKVGRSAERQFAQPGWQLQASVQPRVPSLRHTLSKHVRVQPATAYTCGLQQTIPEEAAAAGQCHHAALHLPPPRLQGTSENV